MEQKEEKPLSGKRLSPWFSAITGTAMGAAIFSGIEVMMHWVEGQGKGMAFKWVKPTTAQKAVWFDKIMLASVMSGVLGYTITKLGNEIGDQNEKITHLEREITKKNALMSEALKKS